MISDHAPCRAIHPAIDDLQTDQGPHPVAPSGTLKGKLDPRHEGAAPRNALGGRAVVDAWRAGNDGVGVTASSRSCAAGRPTPARLLHLVRIDRPEPCALDEKSCPGRGVRCGTGPWTSPDVPGIRAARRPRLRSRRRARSGPAACAAQFARRRRLFRSGVPRWAKPGRQPLLPAGQAVPVAMRMLSLLSWRSGCQKPMPALDEAGRHGHHALSAANNVGNGRPVAPPARLVECTTMILSLTGWCRELYRDFFQRLRHATHRPPGQHDLPQCVSLYRQLRPLCPRYVLPSRDSGMARTITGSFTPTTVRQRHGTSGDHAPRRETEIAARTSATWLAGPALAPVIGEDAQVLGYA